MRVVFMGTPEPALPVLSALLQAGHDVAAVYTRPDRPSGRARMPSDPPVKRFAAERGVPVFQPASLRHASVNEGLAALSPDVIAVAAYGIFLPAATLDLPPLGCLNVHPSLLPLYRGPSPVASAVLNGDFVTGVTIMKLDRGMDTGPVVARRETAIGPAEDAEALTQRLFRMGGDLLVEVLPMWERGDIQAQPQDDSQATTTRLLTREDGRVDWTLDAGRIARQVRAFQPWPGSFTMWGGRLLKITEAAAADTEPVAAKPGLMLSLPDDALGVNTGAGVLVILRLQLEGGRAVAAAEFLRGHADIVGSTLG